MCCWLLEGGKSRLFPPTDVFHPLTAGRLKDSLSLQKCVGIVPSRAGVSPRDNGRSCNGGEIPLAPLLPNSCWRTVGCVTMAAACDKIGCFLFLYITTFCFSLSRTLLFFLLYIHPLVHIPIPLTSTPIYILVHLVSLCSYYNGLVKHRCSLPQEAFVTRLQPS